MLDIVLHNISTPFLAVLVGVVGSGVDDTRIAKLLGKLRTRIPQEMEW